MKNKVFRELQLFAAETGTTVAADLTPAISVDFTSRDCPEYCGVTAAFGNH